MSTVAGAFKKRPLFEGDNSARRRLHGRGGGVMAKTKEHEKERQQLRDLPHDDTHCSVRRGLTACGMGLPARNKLR